YFTGYPFPTGTKFAGIGLVYRFYIECKIINFSSFIDNSYKPAVVPVVVIRPSRFSEIAVIVVFFFFKDGNHFVVGLCGYRELSTVEALQEKNLLQRRYARGSFYPRVVNSVFVHLHVGVLQLLEVCTHAFDADFTGHLLVAGEAGSVEGFTYGHILFPEVEASFFSIPPHYGIF